MSTPSSIRIVALISVAGLAAGAGAQTIHNEIEPNDSKAEAFIHGAFIIAPGDGITGITTGNTAGGGDASPDYFLLQTTPAPTAIYRNRLLLDNPAASWSVTLRGLSQSNGAINFGTDAVVQTGPTGTSAVPRRGVQWYSFGKEEQIVYRISGGSSTSQPYTATLERTLVEPVNLGMFQSGDVEITTAGQGHSTNSALWIFDADLNIIPDYGNDQQPSPGTGNVSRLTRTFAHGTYYMALTLSQLAVPLPAAFDDRRRNAVAMEFPNAVAATTTATSGNLSFQVTDEYGPLQYQAARSESFEIVWYTFTVGDLDPAILGRCCLLDGSCQLTEEMRCAGLGGIFDGPGTSCATGPCPQPGACCLQNFGCSVMLEPHCIAASGSFAGQSTTCENCPVAPCWNPVPGQPGAGPVLPNFQQAVYALGIHNGDLYAGGGFETMDGITVNCIARYDGSRWWAIDPNGINATNFNFPEVRAIASFNGDLYVGGRFETAGGFPASRIARWDGEIWHTLGGGLNSPASHVTIPMVHDMLVWNDGTGDALYITGEFTHANGSIVNHIVKWDGSNFTSLGSGLPGARSALAVFQGQLYAAGGPYNNPIASWNGSFWSSPPGISLTSTIEALAVFDDGAGPALYIGTWGAVYRYDGFTMTDITGDLFAGGTFVDTVYTFATYDDGAGPSLFAGGYFNQKNNFVRRSGNTWETVPGGVGGSDQPYISQLLEHDGALYIAGRFDHVGGNPASSAFSIAAYDCSIAPPCYANCDGSTVEPVLNVDDFTCFINEFAAAQGLPHAQQVTHYANCDGSTVAPALNVDDFTCFINTFAAGCP